MTKKIMVVDDEPDLEMLITQKFRRQIRANEIEFLFARNGIDALKKLEDHKDIDVILTDINMPEMDGLTLLSKLLELPLLTKTLVVSAYGDMSNIRTAMNRGAFDFITKPIDFRDLEVTLDKTFQELSVLKQGRRACITLDAIQQEMELAGKLQRSILPKMYPDRNDVSLFAKMVPAKDIGGDFYDFFFIDPNHLGFAIADVSGKGVTAAIFMAVSRTLLRHSALQSLDVAAVMAYLNNMLSMDNDLCMFVTMFYGILNTKNGELRYSNGGHSRPVKMTQGRLVELIPETKGLILGAMEGVKFEEGKIFLEPGDLLYLYTDGVVEAENAKQEFFTEKRLLEVFHHRLDEITPVSSIATVQKTVEEFVGEADQSDDMTQLAIQYLPTAFR